MVLNWVRLTVVIVFSSTSASSATAITGAESEVLKLSGLDSQVLAMEFSTDSKTLSAIDKNAIHTWDIKSQKKLRSVKLPRYSHPQSRLLDGRRMATFLKDGKTIATVHREAIAFIDRKSGKFLGSGDLGRAGPVMIAGSPDGKALAVGISAGGTPSRLMGAQLWDVATRKMTKQFPVPFGGGRSIAFSPDGKQLAIGSYKNLEVWNIAEDERIFTNNTVYEKYPVGLAFSPNGKFLVSGGSETLFAWNVTTRKQLVMEVEGKELPKFTGSLTFSPDGKHLVLTAGYRIYFWDFPSGKRRSRFVKPPTYTYPIAFSPDQKWLVIGTNVGKHTTELVLWNVAKKFGVATE